MAANREPDRASPFGAHRATRMAEAFWAFTLDRRLAPDMRRRLRKRFGRQFAGPFDVVVDGLAFRTYPAENRDDRVLIGQHTLPEEPERAMLAPLLRPGMVFIDIGANVGSYAAWVARAAGPTASVIAFEPHPRTFAKLEFNLASNGLRNVWAVNAAVAGDNGTMTLFSDGGGNAGHASLLPEGAGTVRASADVRVVSLASILAQVDIGAVDLLKVDVEGFEDRALLPFFAQAPSNLWPRAIMIETVLSHLWQDDCLAILPQAGYRLAASTAENVLLVRD